MAQTYKWTDLITYVSQSNPRLQTDAAGALMCDMVNNFIWGKYDWRISLANLPPFYVVPLQQDYAPPYITMPADFLGLRSGLLIYNGTEPPTTYPPLDVDRYLNKTLSQDRPRHVAFESTLVTAANPQGGLRIYPRPPSGIGPMDYQIECRYKKNPVKVTAATLNSTLPFDDQYFQVYVEGLKYFSKPPSQQSEKEFQNLMAMVQFMAENEAINLGQQPISPREPLVSW